jgi:hypothetical protein
LMKHRQIITSRVQRLSLRLQRIYKPRRSILIFPKIPGSEKRL